MYPACSEIWHYWCGLGHSDSAIGIYGYNSAGAGIVDNPFFNATIPVRGLFASGHRCGPLLFMLPVLGALLSAGQPAFIFRGDFRLSASIYLRRLFVLSGLRRTRDRLFLVGHNACSGCRKTLVGINVIL